MSPDVDELEFLDVLSAPETRESKLYGLCLQIENIVTSYDDRWDAFAEIVQNSVDALLQRWDDEVTQVGEPPFNPLLRVHVNCVENSLSVLDNGCGVMEANFVEVFKPNFSLKRRLGQQNARGEKGAGIVFLQFGHASYRFDTKIGEWQRSYRLNGGPAWYESALGLVETNDAPDFGSLIDPHAIGDEVDLGLVELEQGSFSSVVFSEKSNLPRLDIYFGQRESAIIRLEYILRTRTAAGFFTSPGIPASHPCLDALRLELQVTLPDGSSETAQSPDTDGGSRGFLFPHEIAQKRGSLSSLMSDPASNSELLYQFIDKQFLTQHEDRIPLMSRPNLVAVLEKFEVQGYMSYGYNNRYYEQLSSMHLGFEEEGGDDDVLVPDITQINSGFQIAVREYPNGRRHSFLHRSGAEDKSRSYFLINFRGPYKPDYGRKNVSEEVRPFVLGLCKELISWATAKARKEKLRSSTQEIPHGGIDIETVRENLSAEADRFRAQAPWIDASVAPPNRPRAPKAETELISEFIHLVLQGLLPGFKLYGLSSGMLDGSFDYYLASSPTTNYHAEDNPLGVVFPGGQSIDRQKQWLEFKSTSDLLIDDIKKEPGHPSKKWFTTIHLLVCDSVDDATDDFSIEEVTPAEIASRRFFGVTHFLRSAGNQEHLVQVVELKSLRSQLGVT